MTLNEFSNGIRVILCFSQEEILACINAVDRQHFGDGYFLNRFFHNPVRTFLELPTQDQERVFARIQEKNAKAGIRT